MKRGLKSFAIIVLLCISLLPIAQTSSKKDSQTNRSKIDPTLQFLLSLQANPETYNLSIQSIPPSQRISPTVPVLVEFESEKSIQELEELERVIPLNFSRIGSRVIHTGRIYPASVHWDKIGIIANMSDVVTISSAYKVGIFPPLNVSVPEIKANQVWSLRDIFHNNITGKGIMVADLDTGVDWQHPAFFYANGTGKVLKILDSSGVHVRDVNLTSAPADTNGHGTSVAGIILGGRIGIDNIVGVAPEAALIVGRIFQPYAIPIATAASWAQMSGARVILYEVGGWVFQYLDGSSAEEKQIDQLASTGGVTVVVPAGNLAGSNKHSRTTLPTGATNIALSVPSLTTNIQTVYITALWRTPTNNLIFKLTAPSGTSINLPGDATYVTLQGHQIYSLRSTSTRNTARYDIAIMKMGGVSVGTWTLTISNSLPTNEEINAYIADDVTSWSGGVTFQDFVDDSRTITWPSTADSAISVASYATRARYVGTVGDISYFSGRGPRIDGTMKPDIAAPGHFDIYTTQSQYAVGQFGAYGWFSGTSAAGPHVAGTAALTLQANGALSHSQIKNILCSTARQDSFVGPVPNNIWGWGKIDALASADHALAAINTTTIMSPQTILYVLPAVSSAISTQTFLYVLPGISSITSTSSSTYVLPGSLIFFSTATGMEILPVQRTFQSNAPTLNVSPPLNISLAIFPSPFVKNNTLNATIVIGETGAHGAFGLGAHVIDTYTATMLGEALGLVATSGEPKAVIDTWISLYNYTTWRVKVLNTNENLISIAGYPVNMITYEYFTDFVGAFSGDRVSPAPVYFRREWKPNTADVRTWIVFPGKDLTYSDWDIQAGHSDYGLIEIIFDGTNGRYILLVTGYTAQGVDAGVRVLIAHLLGQTLPFSLRGTAFLVKWVDSNSDGFVELGEVTYVDSYP